MDGQEDLLVTAVKFTNAKLGNIIKDNPTKTQIFNCSVTAQCNQAGEMMQLIHGQREQKS